MPLTFSIENMHCASCIGPIEKQVHSLTGVTGASVNFANKTLKVEGKIEANAVKKALSDIGYTATELQQDFNAEQSQAKQFHRLLLKSLFAIIVGIPLFIDLFVPWLPSVKQEFIQWPWVIVSVVTLLVLIISGGHIYRGAFKSLLNRQTNMDTLVALGTGVAWAYSTAVILLPMWIPLMAKSVYFDTAAILIAFIVFGNAIEIKARGKTSEAIKKLIKLRPKTATLVQADGQEVVVEIEKIKVGDVLRVKPGEVIAVDGAVLEGESQVDESMLTGEPMPVRKQSSDEVAAGTINKLGSFLFKATRVGRDTALARIVDLVEQAQNTKPKIGRLADKVAGVFVPSVIFIAIITAIMWGVFGPYPPAGYVLITTIAVLVIACPCALGLATPISIVAGVGVAAEKGILIRNGDALQTSAKLEVVVLDKTGTITAGKPSVTEIVVVDTNYSEVQLLQWVASVEVNSEHPLAEAIVASAQQRQLTLLAVNEFLASSGLGVKAKVEEKLVKIGNEKFLQQAGINTEAMTDKIKQLAEAAMTPICVAVDGKAVAIIAISDPIKPDSVAAISQLKQMGLRVVMLTGDNSRTAKAVATATGVDEYIAEVLPLDKTKHIETLQQSGLRVAMVGDGINDAPALARADVGFAIGTGTDIAIESADITLMSGSLANVANSILISKATIRNIKQNLFGAFIYNSLGIPIAAGVFYPWLGILLSPIIAGAAMALSSVTVVLNANRLRFMLR